MPLDPGSGAYTSYPTSNARSIRRNPRTGQTAFVPYEYVYRGEPSSLARGVGSFISTLNPVSATERFLRDYRASQARMAAYQGMSEGQQNAFDYQALHPPAPGRLEGLGLPNPQSPEQWGEAAAAFMPWRFPRAQPRDPINIDIREGPNYDYNPKTGEAESTHTYRTKHFQGHWHDVSSVERAAIATDARGRFMGSANWIPGREDEPTYLANIFIQPEHRGNSALFRKLGAAALADAQKRNAPVRMMFADPKLQKVADRWFRREGWEPGEEDFFDIERTYYPPTRGPSQWPGSQAWRRMWSAGET